MSDKIRAFNKVAGVYDDWYGHTQGKQVFIAELDAVDSMLPETGLGLEVGSGTGAFTKELEHVDRTIIGLDPSREMLMKAREKGVQCVMGYGHYPPFRRVFDFSYMVTVIEFLDTPVKTLEEVGKVMRAGASFTLLFINADSSWGALYKDIGSRGDTVFRHARLYSLTEISEILVQAGYALNSVKGTLSSDPMSTEVRGELVEACDDTGVILVRGVPRDQV